MNKFVNIYKDLVKVPDLKKAIITKVESTKSAVAIQVTWGFRNLSSKKKSSKTVNYLVQNEDVHTFPPSPMDKLIILSALDDSGSLHADIIQDDDTRQLVVHKENGLVTNFNLKELDLHGMVYSDAVLASLRWSPNSTQIAFVAEKKRPKPCSFLTENKKEEAEGMGKEYCFYDEWGEQMEGIHQSTLVVADINSCTVKTLDFPDGLCGGNIQWTPDGKSLVGVAYFTEPYRLGLVYCHNRKNVIFKMDLDGTFAELTDGNRCISRMRLSPDGSKMVFLSSKIGGPHVGSAMLCVMDCTTREISTLVDEVARERKLEDGSIFRGFNSISGLTQNCWSKDSKHVFVSTLNYYKYSPYVVNTESGSIAEIPYEKSLVVHDVREDWILLSTSSFSSPSQILLAHFCPSLPEWNFIPVSSQTNIEGIPSSWQDQWTFVNPIPHPIPKYADLPIPVIYVGPTKLEQGQKKRPLIVWPHGGPHSAISSDYSLMIAFFMRCGYSIVFPNFRGSLGQGKDSIESLPSHCGTTDVQDVHQCTLHTLKRYKDVLDEKRIFLNGGSHGGFLVCHLPAAFPDTYKAVCSRNPVCDISSMSRISDIPDWCFAESGLPDFNFSTVTYEKDIGRMQSMSPIAKIDSFKAPICFYLGSNDRRVPFSQGLYFYKMLLARGVKTRAFVYKDNHGLLKLPNEADHIIQMALWYSEHDQESQS